MFINSEEIKTLGLSQVDMVTAATSTAKGLLAITTEATGYSKKSVENGFRVDFKSPLRRCFDGGSPRRHQG
jgi:hypothetical protein